MNLTYLGHSCFLIEKDEYKILIDPFLVACPKFIPTGITHIFVSHGHSDHLGSAVEISKQTGAEIISIFELANYCARKGANANGIGLGSRINFEFGNVIAVPAFHSSSTPDGNYAGNPCGFVFEIDNIKIYHAGDTSLNSEMKMIGEVYAPDVSILPVGGHYTLDINHSVIASNWLKSNKIIPMHYNTFPQISVNIADFELKMKDIGKEPIVMNVYDSITF